MSNPMFQDQEIVEDEVLDNPTNQQNSQVDSEKIRLMQENQKLNAQLANLTGNPNVIKVLHAAQQGKDITVVPVEEFVKLQKPVEKEPEPDFSTFTPEDIIKYTERKTSNNLKGALQETLKEVLTPLQEEIKTLKSQIHGTQEQQINKMIEEAVTKTPDMKNYLEEMRDLSIKHPSITNLNQLYVLAKANKGEIPPNVSSGERPSNPPARKKIVRETSEKDIRDNQTIAQKLEQMLRNHDTIKSIKTID